MLHRKFKFEVLIKYTESLSDDDFVRIVTKNYDFINQEELRDKSS